jgi:hypothetical protein
LRAAARTRSCFGIVTSADLARSRPGWSNAFLLPAGRTTRGWRASSPAVYRYDAADTGNGERTTFTTAGVTATFHYGTEGTAASTTNGVDTGFTR